MYPLSGPSCTLYILGDVQTSWIISRVTFHHAVNVQHLLSSLDGNIFKVLHDSGLEELWALCLGKWGHWILSPWVLDYLCGNVGKHQGLESWGRSSQVSEILHFALYDLVFTSMLVWPSLTKCTFGEMSVLWIVNKKSCFPIMAKV